MTRGSIRTQLIVWNVAALAALLLVLGLLVRSVVFSSMMASVDRDLEQRTRQFVLGRPPGGPPRGGDFLHGGDFGPPDGFRPRFPDGGDARFSPDGPPPPRDEDAHRGPPHDADPYRPRRYDLTGKPMERPDDARPLWDKIAFARARQGEVRFSNVVISGVSLRVVSRPFPLRPPARGIVQAAYPLTDVQRAVSSINRALLLLSPVALLFAALGGALLTGRVLRQVRLLASAASRIRASHFSDRLPVSGRDEFAALATTFNAMLARLEAAFERQRRFTGDASHELKTPLTIIKGNTSLALSAGESMDAVSVREIDKAADTMMGLVGDLLLLARSDEGQLGKNRIELLLREVLERAIADVAPPPRAAVRLCVADETLSVMGNETELARLFSNLLDNAARHTLPDGEIIVTARRDGKNAIVAVADTGIGIAAQHLPHLGERFYRVDDARARAAGGTGLGLSICRGIVEAYGGTLTFASELGCGTTVMVSLPAAAHG